MAKYRIMGTYQGRTEEIDAADSEVKAETLLAEYRMAFGKGWALFIKPPQKRKPRHVLH